MNMMAFKTYESHCIYILLFENLIIRSIALNLATLGVVPFMINKSIKEDIGLGTLRCLDTEV